MTIIDPKKFSDRLIESLEKADYEPKHFKLALEGILEGHYKELGIDKFSIDSFLTGGIVPTEILVHFLAEKLEEDPEWLAGRKNIHTPPKPSR